MRPCQRVALILAITLVVIPAGIGAVSNADSVKSDGFISDDNTTRVVDYRIGTKTVPVGEKVEARVVLANYGTTDKTVTLNPEAIEIDPASDSYIGDGNDHLNVSPSESYTFTIEPGKYRVYSFFLKFNEKGDYAVRMTDGGNGPTSLR